MARNHSKDLEPEEFKRFTGVYHPTFEKMLAVLYEHESYKKKSRRPPELSLQDQLLVALQHWRCSTGAHTAPIFTVSVHLGNRATRQDA
jgi:hypothetical protein